jgi:uncharacterized Zn-binding protein involved in type VI secretion
MTYWATDKAGNRGKDETLWFFMDNVAPVTTVLYNGPMATAGGQVFVSPQTAMALSTADLGSGVNRTEYKLDNGNYHPYTEALKLISPGQHTILYRSSDNVGNSEEEKTLKITVDMTPPTTNVVASSSLSNKDIDVSLSTVDVESGVCGTYFRVVKDKATQGEFQNGTQLVIEAKSGGSADGNYTVQYYSVDGVGNRETTRELKVRIDTVILLRVTGGDRQSVGKDRFTIEGKAEVGSNVTVNGKRVAVSGDGSFSVEVSLKPGSNNVKIQATDPAGNTLTKTVYIDFDQLMTIIGWFAIALVIAITVGIAARGALLHRIKGKKVAPKEKTREAEHPIEKARKSQIPRK